MSNGGQKEDKKKYSSEDLAILAFNKNSRHTHQNRLKLSPVSERSAYSLQKQNYVCFSPLTNELTAHHY